CLLVGVVVGAVVIHPPLLQFLRSRLPENSPPPAQTDHPAVYRATGPGRPRLVAPAPPPAAPPVPTRYRGSVDLLVLRPGVDGGEVAGPLSDPRAMPVRTGDHVKVVAAVEPPAYLYLFWIDEAGAGVPVYPWRLGEWGSRPAAEAPVPRLE